MSYERATFPVANLKDGNKTELKGDVLSVSRAELKSLILEDTDITDATVRFASPGDSVRIVNWRDIVEPIVKVDGAGTVYPGVFGRPTEQVGDGRTNRLAGVAVIQCADTPPLGEDERTWPPLRPPRHFLDMIGPGSNTPYGSTHNVCLEIGTRNGLSGEDWHTAIGKATLKVADRLAMTTLGLEPGNVEEFDTTPVLDLPKVTSIFNLASDEWFCGARSVLGTSIYGQTRLSAPWLISPTELFDGAVYHSGHSGTTWQMTNNPVALKMAREHGSNCSYLGVIIQRTNWTLQSEKEVMADRLAHLAKSLGAEGAVLTTDIRGQRFVETILGVRACERAGIPTVLLTQEEDNENGTAPPLLISAPEVVSVVTTGTGGQEELFPAVEQVIGAADKSQVESYSRNEISSVDTVSRVTATGMPADYDVDSSENWKAEQAPIHGQYGQSYYNDLYGYGYVGRLDY